MNAHQRRLVRRQMDGKREQWLKRQSGLIRRLLSVFKKEK